MASLNLTATVLAPDRLDPAMLAAWAALNATVPALGTPFFSAGFVRAVHAAGRDVRVCVILQDGRALAFFPYEFTSRAAALAGAGTPVGAHMSDYVGLIAPTGLQLSTGQLLALARLNTFTFSHLDETQCGYGLAGEQPRIGLRLQLDAADPLGALARANKSYYKDSERCERHLARDVGPLTFAFDHVPARAEELDKLIAFKRAQYASTGVVDALAPAWTRTLLHQLAALDTPSCAGRLATLYAGGQWVASHFGLAGHGVLHHWMPVYDPQFGKYAPGRLLMHLMIAQCPGAGLLTIDHGEGDSKAKRYVSNEEHAYLRGAWHNGSLMSVASRGYQSLLWRIKG